jgi:SpoVK/Ycf46/Vps4 family AAA+-type ATPase
LSGNHRGVFFTIFKVRVVGLTADFLDISLIHFLFVLSKTDKFTGADLTEICQRAAKLGT